jgi:CBS domain-containing protein
MQLKDVTTVSDLEVVRADMTLKDAATLMRKRDLEAIAVSESGHLVGVITDFDIIVRSTAEGRHPTLTLLRDLIVVQDQYGEEEYSVAKAV